MKSISGKEMGKIFAVAKMITQVVREFTQLKRVSDSKKLFSAIEYWLSLRNLLSSTIISATIDRASSVILFLASLSNNFFLWINNLDRLSVNDVKFCFIFTKFSFALLIPNCPYPPSHRYLTLFVPS